MKVRIALPATVLLLVTVTCYPQWSNMRDVRVAVLDVVSRVRDEAIDTATLTEMLQVALVDKNSFKVVERSLIEKILKEQELQVSGMTDAQIARIGALAGANKILALSISKMGDSYIFIAKSIDTTTGIVDLSDQVLSASVMEFIDLFPVLADRIVRKAKGESVPAFRVSSTSETTPTAAGPSPIPKNGLVSEWLFDGAIRDRVMRRLGKVVDVKLGKDRFGRDNSAGYFNGVTSCIDAGSVFKAPVGAWSVSLWFFSEEINRTVRGVVRGPFLSNWNRYVEGGQRGFCLGHFYNGDNDDAHLNLTVCDGVTLSQSVLDPMLFKNYEAKYRRRWVHLCVVVENGKASMYTDGGLAVRDKAAAIMVPDDGSPTWIGRSDIDPNDFFKGVLDDIRIYERALEEDEILALYDEGR